MVEKKLRTVDREDDVSSKEETKGMKVKVLGIYSPIGEKEKKSWCRLHIQRLGLVLPNI